MINQSMSDLVCDGISTLSGTQMRIDTDDQAIRSRRQAAVKGCERWRLLDHSPLKSSDSLKLLVAHRQPQCADTLE